MANTLNITQNPEQGKRVELELGPLSLRGRLRGRRMKTLIPLLLICFLATTSLGTFPVQMTHPVSDPAKSDAEKSFEKLKTLEGSWEGPMTTVPQMAEAEGKIAQVSLRVTSTGNALMHEMRIRGLPDNPITMFYVDGNNLLLTHYCDAGNRPRMEGKVSPDGKSLEFDLLDVAGGTQHGHMHHMMFTIIDANHHTEEWTYMNPSGKQVRAHYDLRRTK